MPAIAWPRRRSPAFARSAWTSRWGATTISRTQMCSCSGARTWPRCTRSCGPGLRTVGMEFEHQVILENLELLDFLALSRRYAEVQVQALEQELQIYRAALQTADEALSSFARQTLPQLEQQLEGARKARTAVQP